MSFWRSPRDTEPLILECTIQSPGGVFRDFIKNLWWAVGVFLTGLFYASLSSFAVSCAEYGRKEHLKNEIIWDYWNSLYFTLINMTTTGFGDFVPASGWGKLLAIVNALVGLVLFGLLVAIFAMALQESRQKAAENNSLSIPENDPQKIKVTLNEQGKANATVQQKDQTVLTITIESSPNPAVPPQNDPGQA